MCCHWIKKPQFKGTVSRISACSLIKLHFSNLLLILSVNNPTHMYLSDLRVYFKVEEYFRVTWMVEEDGGVLKSQKTSVDYANTTNIECTVDRKVLFHGSLIYSYFHIIWSSDCQGSVHIGSLTTLWHDHIAWKEDRACPDRKTAFWWMSMRWNVTMSL